MKASLRSATGTTFRNPFVERFNRDQDFTTDSDGGKILAVNQPIYGHFRTMHILSSFFDCQIDGFPVFHGISSPFNCWRLLTTALNCIILLYVDSIKKLSLQHSNNLKREGTHLNYDRHIYCPVPAFDRYSFYRKSGNVFTQCDDYSESLHDLWIVGTSEPAPGSFTIDPEHVKSSEWVYQDRQKVLLTMAKVYAWINDGALSEHGIEPSKASIELGNFAKRIRASPSPMKDILTLCHQRGMPTFAILGGSGEEWQDSHIGFSVEALISDLGNLAEWIRATEEIEPENRQTDILDLRRGTPRELKYVDLRLELIYEDNWPRMKRVCGDLLHAARIGVFFNSLGDAERPIRECPSCHELFERTRKHQLYCDVCGSKSSKQARWRAKKAQRDPATNGGGVNGKEAR